MDLSANQRGIQSVEVGGQLLHALVHHGASMALKDLAREAGMTAAKAHPYLVSFGRIGLVVQRDDGRYALGSLALELGLISLQQTSPVHIATPLLAPLSQTIGHTVAIATWGVRGPTIVRVEESPAVVFASMRHGTVFSLSNSASGRLFAAYRDRATVRTMLQQERANFRTVLDSPGSPVREHVPTWAEFQEVLRQTRVDELGLSEGEIVEGINAMAAPVFGPGAEMVLSLTAIGPRGTFSLALDGPIATALKACATGITAQLGGRRPAV